MSYKKKMASPRKKHFNKIWGIEVGDLIYDSGVYSISDEIKYGKVIDLYEPDGASIMCDVFWFDDSVIEHGVSISVVRPIGKIQKILAQKNTEQNISTEELEKKF